MKKTTTYLIIFIALGLFLPDLQAQPTFAKDIAPIIYNKCTNCHRPGEIAPFSLTNYNEVKLYAPMVKYTTEIRYMPPWQANPNFSRLMDENFLTDAEIQLIADWVNNGTPYGNPNDEPLVPVFPEGSVLGEPDLVLSFAERHHHVGNNRDNYWYIVLPTGLTENKFVKAVEMRPGNKELVHHALFFQDTTGHAKATADSYTQAYGFPNGYNGFNIGTPGNNIQFPGYVPGQKPKVFPDGTAQVLNARADLVMQIHYAPTPVDGTDSSSINIFFADEEEEIERLVKDRIMLPSDLPGGFLSFSLPPGNDSIYFKGTWNINRDLSLLSVSPHMHYLGSSWKVWLEKPGGEIVNLVEIPRWDFNWQGDYFFRRMIVAPAGSKVVAEAIYDNSAGNPHNPNNPPQWVFWGDGTGDEMYYLPVYYVEYKAGDENIIFEEDDITSLNEIGIYTYDNKIYNIYPNPSNGGTVSFNFSLQRGGPVDISIYDITGKLVRNVRNGEFYSIGQHTIPISTGNLSEGVYMIQLTGKNFQASEKLIITK
jgi:hypothetical protein